MINNIFDFYQFGSAPVTMLIIVWIGRTLIMPMLLAWIFVRITIDLSRHFDVMARPSSRGAHTIPTPRLGGVGSALAFYLTTVFFSHWKVGINLQTWHLVLMVGGIWALIGGALDDFLELPPKWKQLLQVAPCGAVLAFGFAPNYMELPLFGWVELSPWVSSFIAVVATLLFMNIFNFMDGMDGHAALFGIVTGLALALWLGIFGVQGSFRYGGIQVGNAIVGAFTAVLVGTLGGLLYYNHPKQRMENKTFMGDSGSQFYGFCLAVLALQAGNPNQPGRFPWIASLILFSPFIYDAAYTIVLRIKRGEKLTQAHKSHLYQRLMVAGWSHARALKLCCAWWLVMVVLAWGYSFATAHGNALMQIVTILASAGALSGFTYLVKYVERVEAEKLKAQKLKDEQFAGTTYLGE